MHYGYIYKTTNKLNDKVYIGQHKGEFTDKYYGSGLIIRRALKKDGKDNFRVELIMYCSTREMANWLEKQFIWNYRNALGVDLYNISDGGTGGDNLKNNPNREQIYKRISQKLTGRKTGYCYWRGKHHSPESNIKRSLSQKGKTHSIEWGERIGQAQIGNKRALGFKWSQESRDKLRKYRTGKKLVGGTYGF